MERNEQLINETYIRLIEIISFSKMQMETLGSNEVFNRHVIKVLPEMAQLIGTLCEAGATAQEIGPAVEQFRTYVRGAAMDDINALEEDLMKYEAYASCVNKSTTPSYG